MVMGELELYQRPIHSYFKFSITLEMNEKIDELVNISKKITRDKYFYLDIFPLNVLKKNHYSPISVFSNVNAKKTFQP
jgi:hypothetical protein